MYFRLQESVDSFPVRMSRIKNGRRSPLPSPVETVELRSTGRVKDPSPHKRQANYAALPEALPSRVFSPPTLTLICLGFASAFFAKVIFRTPLSYVAETFSGSTVVGKVKERVKLPYCRSTRRKFSSFSSFSNLRSPCTVRVLFSMRTSMSFSSIPGTSIFRVTLCSSSYTSTGGTNALVARDWSCASGPKESRNNRFMRSCKVVNSRNGSQRVKTVMVIFLLTNISSSYGSYACLDVNLAQKKHKT